MKEPEMADAPNQPQAPKQPGTEGQNTPEFANQTRSVPAEQKPSKPADLGKKKS